MFTRGAILHRWQDETGRPGRIGRWWERERSGRSGWCSRSETLRASGTTVPGDYSGGTRDRRPRRVRFRPVPVAVQYAHRIIRGVRSPRKANCIALHRRRPSRPLLSSSQAFNSKRLVNNIVYSWMAVTKRTRGGPNDVKTRGQPPRPASRTPAPYCATPPRLITYEIREFVGAMDLVLTLNLQYNWPSEFLLWKTQDFRWSAIRSACWIHFLNNFLEERMVSSW